jgi:hypothetical protein
VQIVDKTIGNCCGGCIEVTLKLNDWDLEKINMTYFADFMKLTDRQVLERIIKIAQLDEIEKEEELRRAKSPVLSHVKVDRI